MENTYNLPEYYLASGNHYLDEKISEIPDGKSLVFITDTHWSTNTGHSTEMIRYIRDHAPIEKIIFGGDYLDRYETSEEAFDCIRRFTDPYVAAFGEDYLPVTGNHDTNMANALLAYPDDPAKWDRMYVSYKSIYDLTLSHLKGAVHPMEAGEKIRRYTSDPALIEEMESYLKGIYYVDDDENKVRYIVVNTTSAPCYGKLFDVFGFSFNHELVLQLDWLAETLMSTPEGYDVVVAGHMMVMFDRETRRILPRKEVGLLAAFVKKVDYTFEIEDMPSQIIDWYPSLTRHYDFTQAPKIGKFLCLTGDQHADGAFSITLDENGLPAADYYDGTPIDEENGFFPLIMTATDSVPNSKWPPFKDWIVPMEKGTVSEQLFDVVTLHGKGVTCTRFGAGNSREISINWLSHAE